MTGVRQELRDQFFASCNGKPPWSSQAFVRIVRRIEHHDAVTSGILTNEFHDKGAQYWMKQAVKTIAEATELYMVITGCFRLSNDSCMCLAILK